MLGYDYRNSSVQFLPKSCAILRAMSVYVCRALVLPGIKESEYLLRSGQTDNAFVSKLCLCSPLQSPAALFDKAGAQFLGWGQ